MLPRWLICLAEQPGIIDDVQVWLEAWQLRNRLVNEYLDDHERFAQELMQAEQYCQCLFRAAVNIRSNIKDQLDFAEGELPVFPSAACPD